MAKEHRAKIDFDGFVEFLSLILPEGDTDAWEKMSGIGQLVQRSR